MKGLSTILLFGAASLLLHLPTTNGASSNFTDVDILNFALNLECLEAEFYSFVAYGEGIYSVNSSLVGSGSALTATSSGATARSSTSGAFSADAIALATEIAENEIAHVRFLRSALTAAGATPVSCPKLSLTTATFTAAATAAVSAIGATINPSSTFDPYSSEQAFFLAAYIFEDVGVTAYKGAVQVLQSQTYATVASGIEAVEAGHAAIIRYQLYQIAGDDTGLTLNDGTAITFTTAVTAINKLRDALGGTASSSVENGLTRTPTAVSGVTFATNPGPDLFAADANSVAFTRIPAQVLNIVYFGKYSTPGGFFPSGIAGNTNVVNVTGAVTTSVCSGALSMASLSAAFPMLLAGLIIVVVSLVV